MGLRRIRTVALSFCICSLASTLTSCVSSRVAEPAHVPRFVDLREEPAISTFHFPRGLYSLDSEDAAGYYYRAPRSLIKHSFAGFAKYDGGIFVPRTQRTRIRGYVVWAGGVTRIGNLAHARYAFRD